MGTDELATLAADPAALEAVDPDRLPELVGEAAGLHARLLARLMAARTPETVEAAPATGGGAADRLLTADEVAERLGVDRRWIYRHQDDLPTVKLSSGTLRIPERELERWIDRRRER